MDLSFLDNDERTANDAIGEAAEGATGARIAVAFAKGSGLNASPTFRRLVEAGTEVRVIAGVDFQLTDLQALDEFEKPPSSARVYFRSSDVESRTFHPKVYLFERANDATAIVGSSNLTRGGLLENLEANLVVRAPRDNPLIRRIRDFHDALWNSRLAIPVSGEFRERYQRLQDRRRAVELALRSEADYTKAQRGLRAAVAEVLTSREPRGASHAWLLITSSRNYLRCIDRKVWGDEDLGRIGQVKTGDLVFFYITKDQYLASMGVITEPPYEDHTVIWEDDDRVYPFRFHFDVLLRPPSPVPFTRLISRLDLFDRRTDGWGMKIRAAMKALTPHDCVVLREALAEVEGFGAAS